jgi:hypothetical protein
LPPHSATVGARKQEWNLFSQYNCLSCMEASASTLRHFGRASAVQLGVSVLNAHRSWCHAHARSSGACHVPNAQAASPPLHTLVSLVLGLVTSQ